MSTAAIIEARDFLLAHRTDYTTAYRDFHWPELSWQKGHQGIKPHYKSWVMVPRV